jgi:hypothetical protein
LLAVTLKVALPVAQTVWAVGEVVIETAAFTINVAVDDVAEAPPQPVTMQSNVAPESPVTTPVSVSVAVVEPEIVPPLLIFEPFSCHWYVTPLAGVEVTVKLAFPPEQVVALAGFETVGLAVTVSATALEVTGVHGDVPLTTTSYVAPESPATTPVNVSVAVAEPEIVPPSIMFEPFFRHW